MCIRDRHISNNDFSGGSHEMKLIKLIGTLFYKILCYDIAKERTAAATFSTLGVRQKLDKLSLIHIFYWCGASIRCTGASHLDSHERCPNAPVRKYL